MKRPAFLHTLRSSISIKAAFIAVLPVLIAAAYFAYHHYSHDRSFLFHSAEAQLLRIGDGFKGPAEALLDRNDVGGLRAMVVEATRGSDIKLIVIVDQRAQVVACSEERLNGSALADVPGELITANDIAALNKSLARGYSIYFDPDDDHYCLVMPLYVRQGAPGAALISLDLEGTGAAIRQRSAAVGIAALAASAVLGVTIYYLFHTLFTGRIKLVSAAAGRLAGGDTTVRAADSGSDEIGQLASSFNVLAEEITNWRNNLEEMANSRMSELLVLFDVVNTISQSLELSKVLPNVLDCVLTNLATMKGAIVIVGSDGTSLSLACQRGLSEESGKRIGQGGQGGVGDVILRKKAMRVSTDDGDATAGFLGLEQEDIQSALVVPISAHGVVYGALAVYCVKPERFTDADEALVTTIGNQLSVAVLNSRLYEKTLELAREDGLTKLANRRRLMEILQQEVVRSSRYQTALSVLMFDLDKFKRFNDTYGHLEGDELLKAFGSLVKRTIRATDIPGRYGGEEFVVILTNTSLKGALVIAERIRTATEQLRITLADGGTAGTTVSIGVAELAEGQDEQALLGTADAALYRAKEGGRNRVAS